MAEKKSQARLREKFHKEVAPALMKEFNLANPMAVPRMNKIVVNFTLGLKDQLIFPEIDYAKVDKMKGMNVTIVTTAKSDNEARALLRHMGMPFRQQQ